MPRHPTTTSEPKHAVISLRMTRDRMALLQRYRAALVQTRGHDVSLGETVFSVLRGEARELERIVARHEFDQAPTLALYAIRRAWQADRSLSATQWASLADYVHAGTDTEQQPPHPASLTPAACRTLLDAFEAVYRHRRAAATDHRWRYEECFGPDDAPAAADGNAPDGDRVLTWLAQRRNAPPAARAASLCLRTAVHHEDVPAALLDRYLAPHWPILWRLAARGHWLRHHRPVRLAVHISAALPWPTLPAPTQCDDVVLSFTPTESADFVTTLTFGAPQRVRVQLRDYLKLVELRALLAAPDDLVWQGHFFSTQVAADTARRLLLIPTPDYGLHLDLAPSTWEAMRTLLEDACGDPLMQPRLDALADEYGAPV